MDGQFTLGVEEEFQIVDPLSGELRAQASQVLVAGQEQLGEQIKPEMLQSVIEATTHVCRDVAELRTEVCRLRSTLAALLRESSLALVAAGTHPTANWQDQQVTERTHYRELVENLQDVVRSILIFGLHVHIAVPDRACLVDLMNEVRYFLPHMLALSTSSPFWMGRNTGLKSYRTIVWRQFPRTGIPDVFKSWAEFDAYIERMVRLRTLDESRKVWWDLRPHPRFGTLEFRICDVPVTADETIALAALFQAIVAKLYKLRRQNLCFRVYPRELIEENKWRAARYGLDGALIDYGKDLEVPARDLVGELLEFVDDVLDDLGSREEMATIQRIVECGTGAERQLAVYERSGHDLQSVVHWLMQETTRGLAV